MNPKYPQMTQIFADKNQAKAGQNDLRQSVPSADRFIAAPPQAIEVHIEELVLHGFSPNDRWRIGDALENELRDCLAREGIPAAWRSNPQQLDAGSVRSKANLGAAIARAIHGGAR